jgi:hypothetical protein
MRANTLAVGMAIGAFGGTAVAQDTARSPYLACAAAQADRAGASETIAVVQARAARSCEPLLERNVNLTVSAMKRSNAASASPLAALPDAGLKQMVRPKLREALARMVAVKMSSKKKR